jgi:hypothetical protein
MGYRPHEARLGTELALAHVGPNPSLDQLIRAPSRPFRNRTNSRSRAALPAFNSKKTDYVVAVASSADLSRSAGADCR